MAKAKTAANKEAEQEIRHDNDYKNALDEYETKQGAVTSAVDMISQDFWINGFKSRRDLFDTTRTKLAEVVEENPVETYDSVEDMKALNKAKLAFTKAAADFDNYISDVTTAVNALVKFCDQEDLPLFQDMTLMTASFSRKTGKISMRKA